MQHKLLHLKYVNMQDNASPFFIWSIYKNILFEWQQKIP